MTRRDLVPLTFGLLGVILAQVVILHPWVQGTPAPRPDISSFKVALSRARHDDSVRLAKWTDSLASMPPDTLVRTVTRYVERHRRDTVAVVYHDSAWMPTQPLRELATSDSACRTREDSLRGVVALDSVKARIDSVDRVADLDAVRRQRWTWAGRGLLAGLGVCWIVR